VQTNIVIFEVAKSGVAAPDVTRKLAEKNVLASAIGPSQVRFVTHMDVDRAACARALDAMRTIFPN
jgi:threonine aldolase